MASFLELKNVSFSYNFHQVVLNDISLQIDCGQTLGVVGPNGGGKSTLLKILSGQLRPSSGEIILDGHKIKNQKELCQLVGVVPQARELNVLLPVTVKEFLLMEANAQKIPWQNCLDKVEKLSLTVLLGQQVRYLSGGELQRLLIARALLKAPKLLILDEPGSGLDSQGQDTLLGLILELQKNKDHALAIVDHNLGQVIKLSTKLICLNKSFHWHDHTRALSKDILGQAYHCEFEHLALHDLIGELEPHHRCDPSTDHNHHGHHHGHSHKEDA